MAKLTPYAVLLVKPTDGDVAIRKRFHELSRLYHPDTGSDERQQWQATVDAYNAIKLPELRVDLHRKTQKRAYVCSTCLGCGVVWSRVKPNARANRCATCKGAGIVK